MQVMKAIMMDSEQGEVEWENMANIEDKRVNWT